MSLQLLNTPKSKGIASCPFPTNSEFYKRVCLLPPNEQYELGWRAIRAYDQFPEQSKKVLHALDWSVYLAVIFPSRRRGVR